MGGKSRKSGGVSKKLIEQLKQNSNKKGNNSCGKPKQTSKLNGLYDSDEVAEK